MGLQQLSGPSSVLGSGDRDQSPDVIGMSPICKAFSILMNSNWSKMTSEEVQKIRTEGLCMFQFCIQAAEHQLQRGKFFYIEQPGEASSWDLNSVAWLRQQKGVFLVLFDQCAARVSQLFQTPCLERALGSLPTTEA